MARGQHASTADQVAELGEVRLKPMQRDMFSGELTDKRPKAGRGDHIKLRSDGGERPAVPGMASWADGPAGKRCQQCSSLGAVAIQRPSMDIERASAACLRYCQRVGRLPAIRTDLTLNRACDQFTENGDPEAPHFWLILADGRTSTPDWIDRGGVGRFHVIGEHEDPNRPGFQDSPRRR